ncbi:hypothetical protein ACWJKU_00905 [Methylocaldum sp. MU1018]
MVTTPVPRLILLTLLTLMQVIAPWVHAHTAGETNAFLHMPGLEFLSKSGKNLVQADVSPLDQDIVVGIQAGLRGEIDKAGLLPGADDQPCLPAAAAPVRRPPAADPPFFGESPPPPPHFYRNAAPRAPPFAS